MPSLRTITLIGVLAAALIASQSQPDSGAHSVGAIGCQDLRCERAHHPLGVESAAPLFSWNLQAKLPGQRDLAQTAYRILVASSSELLAADRGDMWDSGKVPASNTFGIQYAGRPLLSRTRYFWKARVWDGVDHSSEWSTPKQYTMGQLHPEDWTAHWIAAEPDGAPSIQAREGQGEMTGKSKPLPVFRREFSVQNQVTQALLFVSGLGQYEVHLNGANVTDAVLTPGWTDYRKRVFYDTYDVGKLLRSGANAIGVLLGNGMYNVEGTEGRYTKFIGSFGQPKLILQLHLSFADGTQTVIASDKTWKTAPGPIIFSSAYGGEDYDARSEQDGWDTPGFDDVSWTPALEANGPGGKLVSERIPLIKPAHIYQPVKITEPRPGLFVYDLGQNFSGWPEITVTGDRGSSVKLIAGELLDSNGLVTQHSANASPQFQNSFTYILKGGGMELWHPRFSYYGFRYVQVECPPSSRPPVVHRLSGVFLHDEVTGTGNFSSSDVLFEQIHNLIDRAILSNMMSVLTDCPQREKLGWLEQTHLAATSIMYNYDVARLYRKMSDDMEDEQLANGMIPSIAPEYVAFVRSDGTSTSFRDSPEWGSAVILSPWYAYQFYGDLGNLASHYESMKRYAGYLGSRTSGHMLSYGLGDWYDIGPKPPGESQLTGKELTATAIYYQDLTVLSQIARLLHKDKDAADFSAEAAAIKTSFNAHLFHPQTNQYDRGSQTANAIPLVLNMVPEGHRDGVLANLIADIRNHSNHVTAGDVGFHYVVRALSDNGQSEVLYRMLSRRDSPSYGYQLSRGATTLTEAWDTNPDFSQNHFMLGHAEEWFYRGLAGIHFELSRPRDERISIQPVPVGDIRAAAGSFRSVLGEIKSSWSRDVNSLQMDVTIPPGATAIIHFPPTYTHAISENGQPLKTGRGIHQLQAGKNSVSCILGSGQYHFEARQ